MKPKDRMRFLILLLSLEFLAASYDVAFTKSSKHILRKWNLLDKTLVKDKVTTEIKEISAQNQNLYLNLVELN